MPGALLCLLATVCAHFSFAASCSLTGLWVIPSLQYRESNLYDPAVYVTVNVTMGTHGDFSATCLADTRICNFTDLSGSLVWPNVYATYNGSSAHPFKDQGVAYSNCLEMVWGEGDDGYMWHRVRPNIHTVHLVYMTHLDIGYTLPTSIDVQNLYFETYFPRSYNTSVTLRANGASNPARFRWTSHPWLLHQMLNNFTGTVTQQLINDFRAAVARDDISWHAGPFNMEAELTDPSLFGYGIDMAHALDDMFNKTRKIALSQKDVPGTTIGIVPVLVQKGVKAIHIGVNDFCTVPSVPTSSPEFHGRCHTFVWRHTGGGKPSEVIAYWCSGYSQGATQPEMIVDDIPGLDEAMVWLMHVDNTGPHLPIEAERGWNAVQQIYPNAQILLSSMDNFTLAVEPHKNKLPVVQDLEVGDSWIYGSASDPVKTRYYRTLARMRAKALQDGSMKLSDPRVFSFSRSLIKLAEHTWGNNNGQLFGANYTNAYFDANYATSNFQDVIAASMDQRAYIWDALASLADHPVRPAMEAAMNASDPFMPNTAAYQAVNSIQTFLGTTYTCGTASIQFAADGSIARFVGSKGRTVLPSKTGSGVGAFRYLTHSEAQFASFIANYSLNIYRDPNINLGFDKLNMDGIENEWQVALSRAYVMPTSGPNGACNFLVELQVTDPVAHANYGAPGTVFVQVNVTDAATNGGYDAAAFDVQWINKRKSREAESLWFTFAPAVENPHKWEVHKLGQWLSPYNVVLNGTVNTHGVWDGVRYLGVDLPLEIDTVDTPLVAVTQPMPVMFENNGPSDVDTTGGMHFCLFNNAWTTNYPLWSLETAARFRFSMRVPA